ncbi:long-chain-fatty-acid--CoA ligase 5-like, partial [Poecilia reticulata]|uniref:long-chain-fatty-acid--CoA ligase 5-like n=1 Tax=Poecilia reticulata TaxID=8081 RepID=UPI0004A3DEB3
MDSFSPELIERGKKCGVDIVSMEDLEALGKNNLQKPVLPKPEDLSVVCFTSGTTGNPKGAMLTHENVVADAAGVLKTFESSLVPTPEDVTISFLPLAHMFERIVQTVIYGAGAKVGFFQGDIRLLPDDMKTLQPTVFPVVPRLLNRIYDKVQSGATSPFKKWLLNFAADRKYAEVKDGIVRKNSIWDKLIFHKVQ